MKKLFTVTCYLFAVAASAATLRLAPGLSAPGIADGVRLDAAVLVSPARLLLIGDPVTLIFR